MKIVAAAIVVLLLFLFMLAMMKLSVTIFFQHAQDDDEWKITFRTLFGIVRYTVHIPLVKVETTSTSPGIVIAHKKSMENTANSKEKRSKYTPKEIMNILRKAREFTERVVHLNDIMKNFFRHVSITKFEWQTKIGTGDAATTGMMVGLGWSLKYSVLAVCSKYMKLKTTPMITIIPSFHQAVSETKFICMIHFRIGHAILAGIRVIKHWRGNRLSEIKAFATQQTNEGY
ncbi:DUF2953 domain-containing protein [Saccharococcus caldoxylosilyticus]|mgnify:CR=1 FL=1|uniref:DUF2953 domain-containing protein n=2 Tax=Saccharococcus caldoxylosilyticus TaxID=81408 RepID=A0A023DDG4_9BACL|nr:DUF2953 domain-containing protein [Parageobacillus caldoxylosilyticus]QNU39321.1 DUF2953 domain-containing protein [Geobacillus sp. 44B]KYD19686.1 hypothetical protein B4119_3198 [Parageobacillus caldoxylosilyticus]MBB3851969.1 hypothetical protein [Parageobacillus caldoxylosilyticus]QXJ39180.1 hypothetical protein BV455_02545 [Parageobacillus caldoxylosilyticus]BDG37132.1 hypothetical protein PcaKH15_30380 [Parageobacillus caldoxylosilyticus]